MSVPRKSDIDEWETNTQATEMRCLSAYRSTLYAHVPAVAQSAWTCSTSYLYNDSNNV
jgi:hypothetical protein